jgi:DNA-binding transcriptional MerR regulator
MSAPQRGGSFSTMRRVKDDSRPIYGIGAAARLLGVPPSTIRAWEDRYGVVSPQRSPAGRRLYSREEMEHLRFVKQLMDDGVQPSDAHRLLAEHIRDGTSGMAEGRAGEGTDLVLVVDRDPHAADLAEYFLRSEGYEVEVALDAAEAERRVAELSPRLVVVELLVGGGRGADLCRHLKEADSAAVLAVSTLNAREPALAAGADAFLPKPLEPFDFLSTVSDLLSARAPIARGVGTPA